MVNPLYDVIEFMSDLDDDMADDEMMTSSDSWVTIDTNEYKFVNQIKFLRFLILLNVQCSF